MKTSRVLGALRPGWRQSSIAVLIMAIAHLFALQYYLWSGTVFGTASDPFYLFLPHSFFMQLSIWNGEFPLWNPYIQYGAPEFYNLHPVTLLIHTIVPDGIWAFKVYFFLPSLLVGCGAWLFLGHFVKSFPVRLLGTLMIQFAPFSFAYMLNPTVLLGYAHVPFLLYLAEHIYRNPWSRWGYLSLSIVVGMLVLNAYAQTILFGLLATVVYFTLSTLCSKRRNQLLLPWAIFMVFTALGIGIGIVSLLLLQVVPGQMPPEILTHFQSPKWYLIRSLEFRDLLTFFSLNAMGNAGAPMPFSFFNNSLPWLTLGVLLYLRRPSNDAGIPIVLVALIALGYFIAFGENNPAYIWLIEKLPWYVRMESPRRAMLIANTMLALLSSLGFLALYRRSAARQMDIPMFAIIVGSFLLTVTFTELYGSQTSPGKTTVYLAYGIAAAMLGTGCWGRVIPSGHHFVLAGLGILILATPLVIRTSHADYRTREHAIPPNLIEENIALELFLGQEDSYYRHTAVARHSIDFHDLATLAHLRPDTQLIYQRFGTGTEMSTTRHLGWLFGELAESNELTTPSDPLRMTRMSAVRWVISGKPLPNTRLIAMGQIEQGNNTTYFYEVPAPLPRAFVPPTVAYAPGKSTMPRHGVPFEPSQLSLIDVGGTSRETMNGQQEQSGPGSVQIASYHNQRVELAVSMEQPGWVILSDTFYPGWTASVDGKPAEIYRANYIFRAVSVPAGNHSVVFSYFPTRLKLGLLSMAISLAAASAITWLIGRHR